MLRVARDRVRAGVSLAERTGEHNAYWTGFGPTKVAVFALSIEVEGGDTSKGLRLAERVAPDRACPSNTVSPFHLDPAKRCNQRQNYAAALAMQQAASFEAPKTSATDRQRAELFAQPFNAGPGPLVGGNSTRAADGYNHPRVGAVKITT